MKVSLPVPSNACCPQAFYLYGTYREDGKPNFGLFCWFGFCLDGELGVMACIGGEKLTKDRIRATGRFSANLVTEELLPLANYWGNKSGYDPDKMRVDAAISRGRVLDVPILDESPWSFELEVSRTVRLDDSEIYICKIPTRWWKSGLRKRPGRAGTPCRSTSSSRWSAGAAGPFSGWAGGFSRRRDHGHRGKGRIRRSGA